MQARVIPKGTLVQRQRHGHYIWDAHRLEHRLVLKPVRYCKRTRRYTFDTEEYRITCHEKALV